MKKKLYLLFTICSICLLVLVACTDNASPNETENTTQGPTENKKDTNGVDTPTQTNETNGANENNTNNTDEDNGIIDDVGDEIEDGIDDINDTINDATDDN